MWKGYFKNLHGNSTKVIDKPITKIIYCQLDIKLGQLTLKELNVVQTKIKGRKAVSLNEIPSEEWDTRKFHNLLLRFFNVVCKKHNR